MAFRLPTFNLLCNIWHPLNTPPAPPDIANQAAQLRYLGKQSVVSDNVTFTLAQMEVLFPAMTDVRDIFCAAGDADIIEMPAGSGRFYSVAYVDDVAKGFLNEYRVAYVEKTTAYGFWPTPIP